MWLQSEAKSSMCDRGKIASWVSWSSHLCPMQGWAVPHSPGHFTASTIGFLPSVAATLPCRLHVVSCIPTYSSESPSPPNTTAFGEVQTLSLPSSLANISDLNSYDLLSFAL
jgi:hypothetical protein